MQDKVGQIFEGIVAGVTGFGLFIELEVIYVGLGFNILFKLKDLEVGIKYKLVDIKVDLL